MPQSELLSSATRAIVRWVTVFAVALPVVATSGVASAHFLGYSAVRNGNIVYQDKTQYDDAMNYEIGIWEGASTVDFVPDAWNLSEDLEFRDDNRCDVSWAGLYIYYSASSDDIVHNVCYYGGYNTNQRREVTGEETGHAHGIAHSGNCSDLVAGYPCAVDGTPTSTSTHDRSDLTTLGLR